jgi:hypothetical protein
MVLAVAGTAAAAPPNPTFTACRTPKKLVLIYHFSSWPTGRDRHPWLLLAAAKSAGDRYPPLTVRTRITQRSGQVVQSLGLGGPPWRVLLSVVAPNGMRSAPISRPLPRCP